jgi:protein TonB
VALAHAGAWLGLDRLRDAAAPVRSFKVIEAALLPPPTPRLLPPAPRPPAPKPREPAPVPRAPAAPRPMPIAPAAMPAAEPSPALLVEAPPAPEPAPVPEPAPPAAVEVPRFNAAYLNNPSPAYPAAARRRAQEGRVLVRAEVLADGRCSRVELKQGSGHELLDQAALEAVRKWRFVPARQGDQAISAWVDVPIAFKLKN